MSPLLGHILAQVVSLGVGDRTEGRYIRSDIGKYYEAATYVRAGLNVGWKHTDLSLGYAPSFTVTPLDSSNRSLLTYHTVAIAGTYRWQHTTFTASEFLGIGQLNFVTQGLTDPRAVTPPANMPNTPGSTPGPGTPTGGSMPPMNANPGAGSPVNQIRALNEVVTYATSATSLAVAQKVSPVLTLTGVIGYQVSGGIGSSASPSYPVIRGPIAQATSDYLFSRRDTASSIFNARYAIVEKLNESWIYSALQSWRHNFGLNTFSQLGAGVSATKTAQPDGTIFWTIYPAFISAFNHSTNIHRSVLALTLTASSSPVIDPVRALVDPRVSLSAGARWTLDDFYSAVVANTDLSLVDANKSGSLSSAAGSFNMGYRLSPVVAMDTGVRVFWQNYEGTAVVPLTWAAFVGLTVSTSSTPQITGLRARRR